MPLEGEARFCKYESRLAEVVRLEEASKFIKWCSVQRSKWYFVSQIHTINEQNAIWEPTRTVAHNYLKRFLPWGRESKSHTQFPDSIQGRILCCGTLWCLLDQKAVVFSGMWVIFVLNLSCASEMQGISQQKQFWWTPFFITLTAKELFPLAV